jgi:uncharacterized membrane protein
MNAAQKSIVVKAPIAKVYERWLHGEEFPKFVTAIKTSRQLDPDHFAILEHLNGERHESVLEFVLRIPERRLVWRSLSDQLAAGVVTFTARADGTTTVALTMISTYGGDVSDRVGAYLQNFKKLIENGPEAPGKTGAADSGYTGPENLAA